MRNIFNTGSLFNCILDFIFSACTFFFVMTSVSNKQESDHIHIFIDMIGWLFVKLRKYVIRLFLGKSGIFKISFSHNLILAGNVMPGTRKIYVESTSCKWKKLQSPEIFLQGALGCEHIYCCVQSPKLHSFCGLASH